MKHVGLKRSKHVKSRWDVPGCVINICKGPEVEMNIKVHLAKEESINDTNGSGDDGNLKGMIRSLNMFLCALGCINTSSLVGMLEHWV